MQINATSAVRASGSSEVGTQLAPVAAQIDPPAISGAANDAGASKPARCVDILALVMESSAAGS